MHIFNELRCWFSKFSKVLPKLMIMLEMKSIRKIIFELPRTVPS